MDPTDHRTALSHNSTLRYLVLFAALFTQGFPLGLFFYAMPIWLAANDVSAAAIGLVLSASTLPWTFKFFAGFLMDRFTYRPMGRRRVWLIASQALIVLGLIIAAEMRPDHTQILLLSAVAFSVNTICAFQDTAISALAVDLVPEDERARANGFILAGEAIGTAFGTILSGILIARLGVDAAFLGMAAIVSAALILFSNVRERPGERLLPWTQGQVSNAVNAGSTHRWADVVAAVWHTMSKRNSLGLAVALSLYGSAFGAYVVVGPILATSFGGWTEESYASLAGIASLTAGFTGMLVFGRLIDRIGARLGRTIGMFGYAMVGVTFLVTAPLWNVQLVFVIVVFAAFLSDTFMRIGAHATAMRLCDTTGAATQFAIFLTCANVGTILSGVVIGWLEALGGQTLILAAGSGAAGLATLIMWRIKAQREDHDDAPLILDNVLNETA